PTAQLFASDPAADDHFGDAIALSGNLLAVAAPLKDAEIGFGVGVVYVFERDGSGTWNQLARLTAPDADIGDNFGHALALKDTTLVVGVSDDDDLGGGSGSAYVFERNAGGRSRWGLVTKLTAPDGQALAWFGFDVAVSGDRIAIGSPLDSHIA